MNNKSNTWIYSFLSTFALGFLIIYIYCYQHSNDFYDVTLADWLGYFVACGTFGSFLYLILDKLENEKEKIKIEKEANHFKWQSEIPFVALSSPCDPSTNYCNINILSNPADIAERGNQYFALINLGKLNAYDISVSFSTGQSFEKSLIFHQHYIPYLAPIKVLMRDDTFFRSNEGQPDFQSFSTPSFIFTEYIYSNYSVSPGTKGISKKEFDICGCINHCNLEKGEENEKYFFVRIDYHSSLNPGNRYKITTEFKVSILCDEIKEPEEKLSKFVVIKGINLVNYKYDFCYCSAANVGKV